MKTAQELRAGNVIMVGKDPMVVLKAEYNKGGRNAATTALWLAWNRRDEPGAEAPAPHALPEAWGAFVARRDALERHARSWCSRLAHQPNLAAALVDFADNMLK